MQFNCILPGLLELSSIAAQVLQLQNFDFSASYAVDSRKLAKRVTPKRNFSQSISFLQTTPPADLWFSYIHVYRATRVKNSSASFIYKNNVLLLSVRSAKASKLTLHIESNVQTNYFINIGLTNAIIWTILNTASWVVSMLMIKLFRNN